jgi:hypothetical protein
VRTIVLGVTWLIVAGVVLLGIVVLTAAVAALLGRMRPLERAVRRLWLRAEQAQGLQAKIEAVQARSMQLQPQVEELAARAEHRKRARQDEDPALT